MKSVSKYRSVLMGLGIIWIYYFHSAPSLEKGTLIWYFWRQGYTGVDLFILLSGFGMAYALTKNPVTDIKSYFSFEGKRFLRIYAGFLPATFLIALVDNWTKSVILGRITYFEQFTENLYIHLWYLGVILVLYLIVPFYHKLFGLSRNKLRFTCMAVGLAMLLGCITIGRVREDIVSAAFTRIPIFFIGIYWGYLSQNDGGTLEEKSHFKKRLPVYAMFAAGVVLTYLAVMDWHPAIGNIDSYYTHWFMFHYSRLLFTPSLILIMVDIIGVVDKIKAGKALNKALSYIGTITLEIYCLHEWILLKCADLQVSIDTIRWELSAIFLVFFLAVGIHKFADDLIFQKMKNRA
ncbi:acyltransferase family protein [Butyrivibrio sp. YAB3001]|uniref:acyltransferase family protein n=1 Tax=Butyrivibrio sp. YAB3001 TaxID=1520812 RepID=UPI0008F675DC|nr:acyltransferase [Butyrivibrio sp. YAB3001]SFB76175.1 Peptidoglycan/LPS O-acetylase OafA/YrhL, contains acyltransferase and SGNH-hydrolase domains [Butyrivibrio sp. YAB3001]